MKNLVILVTVLFVISCKHNDSNEKQILSDGVDYQAILQADNKLIFRLSGKENIDQINKIISRRKPLLRKIMPVFNMQLFIKVGEEEQYWLFSKPNYIMSKTENDNKVYSVDSNLIELFN